MRLRGKIDEGMSIDKLLYEDSGSWAQRSLSIWECITHNLSMPWADPIDFVAYQRLSSTEYDSQLCLQDYNKVGLEMPGRFTLPSFL